ncbi:hypothetical protein ACTA71_009524 [Dictyostelium dimigraforme]
MVYTKKTCKKKVQFKLLIKQQIIEEDIEKRYSFVDNDQQKDITELKFREILEVSVFRTDEIVWSPRLLQISFTNSYVSQKGRDSHLQTLNLVTIDQQRINNPIFQNTPPIIRHRDLQFCYSSTYKPFFWFQTLKFFGSSSNVNITIEFRFNKRIKIGPILINQKYQQHQLIQYHNSSVKANVVVNEHSQLLKTDIVLKNESRNTSDNVAKVKASGIDSRLLYCFKLISQLKFK